MLLEVEVRMREVEVVFSGHFDVQFEVSIKIYFVEVEWLVEDSLR